MSSDLCYVGLSIDCLNFRMIWQFTKPRVSDLSDRPRGIWNTNMTHQEKYRRLWVSYSNLGNDISSLLPCPIGQTDLLTVGGHSTRAWFLKQAFLKAIQKAVCTQSLLCSPSVSLPLTERAIDLFFIPIN